jgi:ABC transporter substrate binding protein
LTTEERLSDIVGNLAPGLLWLDVLRDYYGSIRSQNFRRFVTESGLISFGIDQVALSRLAASYVDRILKGEKPADLPMQAPTKYETVLNIKTAKALGLEAPPSVFARADEVIE